MATVTVMTAARMQEIEDEAVVGAEIVGDHLIMERNSGEQFDAGALVSIGLKSTKQIVIASGEANQNSRDTADFVCDGEHDEVEFLAAIAVLLDDGNWDMAGEILLTEGTFYFDLSGELDDGPFTIEANNITIRGQGFQTTYIEVSHGDLTAFTLDTCVLKDLQIYDIPVGGESAELTLVEMSGDSYIYTCHLGAWTDNIALWVNSGNVYARESEFVSGAGGVAVNVSSYGTFDNCLFSSTGGTAVKMFANPNSGYTYAAQFRICKFNATNCTQAVWMNEVSTDLHGAFALFDACEFVCDDGTLYAIKSDDGDIDMPSTLTISRCIFTTPDGDSTCAVVLDTDPRATIQDSKFFGFTYAIDMTNCRAARILGNQFHGQGGTAIVSVDCERISISGNFFHGFESPEAVFPAVAGQVGIQISSADQVRIVNNEFELIGTSAIIMTTCNESYIGQNYLWRCGLHADNTYSGIDLITSDDVSILGNRISNTSPATQLQYGIEIGSGCDRTYLRDNHIRAAADTAAIQDSGTSTDTTSANKIT